MRPLLLASIVAAWSLGSVAAVPTHFLTPAQDEEFEVGEMYLLEWTPYLSRKEFTRISLSGTNSTDYSSNFADTISNSGFMNQAFGVIFLRDRHSSASQFNVTEIGTNRSFVVNDRGVCADEKLQERFTWVMGPIRGRFP